MPHSRFDWAGRIHVVEREYRALRVALDLLRGATPDEVHAVADAWGWDLDSDLDVNAADWHLDPTYLIRMYTTFERAAISYRRCLPGNQERTVEGNVLLDELGADREVPNPLISGTQDVRRHRNHLVHGRLDDHASAMSLGDARNVLLTYLGRLPLAWGR